MTDTPPQSPESQAALAETGLVALASLLAMHRIAVDPAQLRHTTGHHGPVGAIELVRLAREQKDARARAVRTTFDRLARTPLPALAHGPQGWFVIGRVQGEEALIQLAVPEPGVSGLPVRKLTR